MKKILLLLLAIAGMVSTASAAKLYVNTSQNASWWTNVRIYYFNVANTDDGNSWAYSEDGVVSNTTTLFGKEWYVFDRGDYSKAIVQYFESSDHSITNQSSTITDITHDRFVFIPGTATDSKWIWYENGYTFRSNVLGNWSATTCNMEVADANTLTYTLTKSTITSSGVDKIWFRILNQEGQIYPQADGTTLSYEVGTSTYYNNWDNTSWSFGIEIPSYDYEKIVVTASLSEETWTITADAYITKTVSGDNQYATLGCSVPLEIVESNSVTAYPLTANASTGIISKGSAFTTIPGGEGALLENLTGSDKTIRAKVLASADGSASNHLVATSGTHVNKVTEEDYTNYILAKEDSHVGFYMVNGTSGNNMGANTAYLHVADAVGGARASFLLDSETTAINAVKQEQKFNGKVFNLAGQRIAQLTKGLYIVNGKKVIK